MPKRKPVEPDDGLCLKYEVRQKINWIISTLCQIYGIEPEDLVARSHLRDISEPRQLAMLLIRHTDQAISFETIGRMFDRTYETVRYSCRTAYDLIQESETIRQRIQPVLTELQIHITHA